MRFSIIIPVYNVERYLRDCLDSVLRQSFADWEAVCVNDGSSDGSAIILEEYARKDDRIKVISQPNGGLSAARNAGMKTAAGDYLFFLDSDDWIEDNALEILSRNLDGEDMLCFSGRRYFEEDKSYHQTDQLTNRIYASGMDYYNENALQSRDFAFVCVVLRAYRKEFLLRNNLFFKEGIFHEDNLFTPLACYSAMRVKQISDGLYDYRVRSSSITTTINKKRLYDLLETANALADFFVCKEGFDKTVAYRAITHHYQVVLANASKEDRSELKQLCDWNLYRSVSRTKWRHRVNYIRNRIAIGSWLKKASE